MELNVPSGGHETESNLTTAGTVSDGEDEGVSCNSSMYIYFGCMIQHLFWSELRDKKKKRKSGSERSATGSCTSLHSGPESLGVSSS